MPLRVEGARVSLGSAPVNLSRRSRGLADIAPQYVAKSGLLTTSELEGSRGTSYTIQHVLGSGTSQEGASRFPKLDECAHFHYEHVDIGPIQLSLVEEDDVKPLSQDREPGKHWYLSVTSQGNTWMVRRSFENFKMIDEQLHRCIYDRKFSELPLLETEPDDNVEALLSSYLNRLSAIAGSVINCGPVLNWLEMDNRGNRLLVPDTDNCPINTPAVAAAYTVKKYQAQAPDELSFEVGDMISVIDMPPPEESIWWRGKRGFLVGFFPCECVAVIGDKVPRHIRLNSSLSEPSKSVLRKHGKLIAFFRSFILSRPSRRRLKQSGILKERVFGCDLGEHLQNSSHDIPQVLKYCAEFIEAHGIVDGIYRLSGVTSNIHKLRNAFDEDRVPALHDDSSILQDIHSVASLLKMYFRELPNPLCTYQLYHQFVNAVHGSHNEDLRLVKMRDVVHKLPPPHYRTLEYLMRHLARVADRGADTGMTPRNLAIVWAPNLLRSREFEVGGVAALQFVGVQAVVTEFLVCYVELIFTDKFPTVPLSQQPAQAKKIRPKSLAISTPTKLLSLEEARNRALLKGGEPDYIEVGGGPASLPPRYHTVIELPRKRPGSKRSPLGWRMLFGSRGSKGQQGAGHQRKGSSPAEIGLTREKAMTESDIQSSKRRLRPAKSVESLNSSTGETPGVASPPQARSPILLRPPDNKNNSHNRSVSHESYFDTLQDELDQEDVFESTLDISEIQVNFELEESEMRIFSEDETLAGSGSISFGSPRPNKLSKSLPMAKRISHARLARGEDSLSSTQSADPSPKKLKTQEPEACGGRSRLEERLSTSVGELQFIDSVSPDQIWIQAEVHPIQSPSPVSSISRVSSLLPASSPILPHIPHLQLPETPPEASRQLETPTNDGATLSLQSSTLTTPDTPVCAAYTPLIESPDPPKPEERKQRPYHPYENISTVVKPGTVLETNFDLIDPLPQNRRDSSGSPKFDDAIVHNNRDSISSVKYEVISTESSCDSLIDLKKTEESRFLIGAIAREQFPVVAECDEWKADVDVVMKGVKSEPFDETWDMKENVDPLDNEVWKIRSDNTTEIVEKSETWKSIPEKTSDVTDTWNFNILEDRTSLVDELNKSWEKCAKVEQLEEEIDNPMAMCGIDQLALDSSEDGPQAEDKSTAMDITQELEARNSSEDLSAKKEKECSDEVNKDSANSVDEVSELTDETGSQEHLVSSEENLSGFASIFEEKSAVLPVDDEKTQSISEKDSSIESSETETSSETLPTTAPPPVKEDSTKLCEETPMDTSESVLVANIVLAPMRVQSSARRMSADMVIVEDSTREVKRTQIIPKPPRKTVQRELKSPIEIPVFDKSPTFGVSRRLSSESKTSPQESPKRISSQEGAVKVTARLTDRSSPQSSVRIQSPRKTKEAEPMAWSPETPLRSNSSGNVRQLLNKFEGERPRTLERLSTRRTRETAELDLSDPERRERIEKYKEKRRTYLREKYRTEVEAARRLPPFEKPPRKHPPQRHSLEQPSVTAPIPNTRRSLDSAETPRRSFELPTVSSVCRNSATRLSTERRHSALPEEKGSPEKHRSLDFVPTDSRELPLSSERKVTSPRRKVSTPEATTPPYCIKDMAAMFEQRDSQPSPVTPQKQYLSSV